MDTAHIQNDILDSIERLNRMIVMFSGAGAGLEEKLVKQAAVQSVTGLGEHVDTFC
jgi:hypothetical protein